MSVLSEEFTDLMGAQDEEKFFSEDKMKLFDLDEEEKCSEELGRRDHFCSSSLAELRS